jgi:hypothetical protein
MWSYDANGNASTSNQADIKAFFQQFGDNGGDKDKNKEKNKEQKKETNKEKYERLKKEYEEKYPNKVGKEEEHHIDPQYLGYPKSGETVTLPAPYHQGVTNEWRDATGYGKKKKIPKGEDYEKLKEKIYNKFPLPQADWFTIPIQGNVQTNTIPSPVPVNGPSGFDLLNLAKTPLILLVMIQAAVNTVMAEKETKNRREML